MTIGNAASSSRILGGTGATSNAHNGAVIGDESAIVQVIAGNYGTGEMVPGLQHQHPHPLECEHRTLVLTAMSSR
jgi:hypothetical protein